MEVGVLRRDGRTDPFFDGAAAGRLMIKRCAACARWYTPDASECPRCGAEPGWAEASGRATLVSWAFAHARPGQRGSGQGGSDQGGTGQGDADGSAPPPAVLALVELAEGPWLHSRLDGVARAALREGLPLRAHFVHPDEGESYAVFRAASPREEPPP
ncbi:MAG TPA: OB-fold domain-containing protein [Streptosporangiaceae bacterium]